MTKLADTRRHPTRRGGLLLLAAAVVAVWVGGRGIADPKTLVKYSYFADRVTSSAAPGIVFLGARSLSPTCRIEPAGTMESYQSMIANCVIGLGLFQGLEFVVHHSALEIAGKARVALSRLRNARRLFRRSQVYRLILGRDPAENARAVARFVRRQLPAS